MNISNILRKKIIILDGATGTNLFDKGLTPGEPPSVLNLKNPDAVYELQKKYIDCGSDIILTNTFSANPVNFKDLKYKEIIKAGVKIARRAAGKRRFVLGDVGPLGIMIKPYGDSEFEEVYKIYYEIFKTFCRAGVKAFFIETFNSFIEAKAAFLAGREFSQDIFVSFTFQDNCRTLFGEIPESIVLTFEKLGAKAIGVNCTDPDVTLTVLKRMAQVSSLPLIAKPNAGKVRIEGNRVINSLSDQELSDYFDNFVRAGARMIGGCCGTTPKYIELIHKKKYTPVRTNAISKSIQSKEQKKYFYIISPQKFIKIDNSSLVIVGERLNPSGRKKLKESLLKGDYRIYGEEAKLQEDSGADALDVNAFVPELDEDKTLLNCFYEVMKNSRLPLFIDTQNVSAAEKVMRFYPGLGVYNSVPARVKELKKVLPCAKKYGFGIVISLIGRRIPRTIQERIKNVELAIKIAQRFDYPVSDMIFDPLVFSVATETEQVKQTLKAVEIMNKMGLKTILGISNVSFGLPQRSLLNSALVVLAINSGANFLILNPLDSKVMEVYRSTRAIIKQEVQDYINWARYFLKEKDTSFGEAKISKDADIKIRSKTSIAEIGLIKAIIEGNVSMAVEETKKLIDSGITSAKILDDYIFKAMQKVGENYEKGVFFIPDLLKSAEATRGVLELIRRRMEKQSHLHSSTGKKKVVLATVKGDIHDIGKNIVAMVFESAGYRVIDLGKDVDALRILNAVKKHKPLAVGLSALLTTTMHEMGNVIKLLKSEGIDTPVIIGGPNVSPGFARKIGAYAAANNAFEALKILKNLDNHAP
ncbi:MAG: homocysteine S-methyltransferase family protein [candidate division WOR-3 bacterium]|nr:homocysteine S-methyltransferase family protein [candidate division WOR-3 bacterium]